MKIINFLSLVSTTGAGGVDKTHLGMSVTQSSTLSKEKEKQGREGRGERESREGAPITIYAKPTPPHKRGWGKITLLKQGQAFS